MASARRRPPLQVFEDHHASDAATIPHEPDTTQWSAQKPLDDASSKQNVKLQPPKTSPHSSSPTKKDSSSPPRPMDSYHLTEFTIPPPSRQNFNTDSPTKNGSFYSIYPAPAQSMPSKPYYPGYGQMQNKENMSASSASHGMPVALAPQPALMFKPPMKRALMDSAPLKEKSIKKIKLDNDEPFELPDPSDMPAIHDDGTKPSHSYAELIGMAILRAPNRRLTLAQIYKWISDNYAFYKSTETGWQNSIRHNLSLNKNFIKQERPKDDPGKGNYWAIKPGEERPYLLGKNKVLRRLLNPDGSAYTSEFGSSRGPGTPAISQFTLMPNPVRKHEPRQIDATKFTDDAELSSDGTIPASDPALNDDDKDEDTAAMPPPPTHFRSSPPPADIGSSPPPLMPPPSHRGTTPPFEQRLPSTRSRSGKRRQKFAGMNDSGYWSSIESSAARGATHQLTSEADVGRHRMRKGRAEMEIARMRSSSFDSPSKEQTDYRAPSNFGSSSPFKPGDPLTPAVVFKRPPRPPPSVSPNTNLRNHRNRMKALLGSPAKALSPVPELGFGSPGFNVFDDGLVNFAPFISPLKVGKTPLKPSQVTPLNNNVFKGAFDVFIDRPEEEVASAGSPSKQTRRPSFARATTTTGILADVTGSSKGNSMTLAPPNDNPFSFSPFYNKSSAMFSPAKFESPLKQVQLPPADGETAHADMQWLQSLGVENSVPTSNAAADDAQTLFGVELPSDGSEEAIDIFQDFGKIGQAPNYFAASSRANGSPVKKSSMGPPARPALPRSGTTRW